ncbi:MAG: hypothetical protein CMD83_12630 [Gammaproteobacteria bacterium]|nr:hypothetical protein [Gammaproteobacteria bacterium]MBS02788.1 hypothetical protein [Gammaproteobacteria bacterium]|tara:strand:+ start:1459 stop:1716 length:258 start_codon:yes stop_codon:yes gene_type:complete
MITSDIHLDKLLADLDQQIEILTAIAGDNAILTEQLRILHECREAIVWQTLEMERLAEQLSDELDPQGLTIVDLPGSGREREGGT